MKKVISLITALCIVLGSFSLVFASATSWDTTDQANLQAIKGALTSGSSSIYGWVSSINSRLVYGGKSIANWGSEIYNALFNLFQIDDADVGRKSITYWMREAVLDLDTLTGSNGQLSYLSQIYGALVYNDGNSTYPWLYSVDDRLFNILNRIITLGTYLYNIQTSAASIDTYTQNNLPGIYAYSSNISSLSTSYLPKLETLEQALINYKPGAVWSNVTQSELRLFSHVNLIDDITTGRYAVNEIQSDGSTANRNLYWGNGTPVANLAAILKRYTNSFVNQHSYLISNFWKDTNSNDWIAGSKSNFYTLESRSANLTAQQNTPVSFSDRLFKYLQKTQYDVARLSYVLASDFDIEASQKAQPNQEAVVDNFIDSNGSGSASASDFGSISSLSSGYQTNFSTDANISGIFNIFNSNNMGWFSQETANQLDTTQNNRRSATFETPLLDQQINDIYDQIGVKHD